MASGLLASRKRRLIALGGVTAVAGAVLLYQAYHSETYSAARKYIARVKAALQRYSEGFFTAAELTASVLEDLRRYVQSEDSDLPQSLRQVLKLVESEEVGGATRALVTAAIRGVVASTTVTAAPTNGHAHGPTSGHSNASHTARLGSSQLDSHGSSAINIQLAGPDGRGLVDKVLEALVAPRGLNLVELVVRVAARNSVKEYCRYMERADLRAEAAAAAAMPDPAAPGPPPGLVGQLLAFVATPSGERFTTSCTRTFVTAGMEVYTDRFGDVDAWDQLIASISKPGHRETIERLTSVFVTDCIKAYFGTQRDDRGHEEYSRRTIVTPAQPAMPAHSLSATRSLAQPASPNAKAPPATAFPEAEVSQQRTVRLACCSTPQAPQSRPDSILADQASHPYHIFSAKHHGHAPDGSAAARSSSPVAPITPLSQQPSSATRINAASGTSVSGPASPAEAVGEPGQQVQCASFGAEPQHAQQPAAACSAGISMPAAPAPAAAAGSFFMQEEQEVRWLGAEPTKQSSTSALAGFVQQLASHPEGRSLAVACCGQIGYQAASASWHAAKAYTLDSVTAVRELLAALVLALMFGHVSKAMAGTNGSITYLSSGYVRLACLMLALTCCLWWLGAWQRWQQAHAGLDGQVGMLDANTTAALADH